MTLIDVLIGSALAAVALVIITFTVIFGNRSFAAMANYVSLDQASRNALDRMSKEIRQSNRLLSGTTNSLVFEDFDGGILAYHYAPSAKALYRIKNGRLDARPLLTGCDYLRFALYQRNTITNTYDQYPAATPATCKLVQMSWICSRPLMGSQWNTESVQSAKVVIRKQ